MAITLGTTLLERAFTENQIRDSLSALFPSSRIFSTEELLSRTDSASWGEVADIKFDIHAVPDLVEFPFGLELDLYRIAEEQRKDISIYILANLPKNLHCRCLGDHCGYGPDASADYGYWGLLFEVDGTCWLAAPPYTTHQGRYVPLRRDRRLSIPIAPRTDVG